MEKKHYRESSEGPYLVGSECKSCHTVFFPQKHVCPICAKEGTMVEKPLSRRAKVYSFSYCTVAPAGVKAPYIVGIIEFPEGPKILGIIAVKEPSPTALEIGDDVELIIGKIGVDEQGRDIINYFFKPVKD